jgi:hypothetical protein
MNDAKRILCRIKFLADQWYFESEPEKEFAANKSLEEAWLACDWADWMARWCVAEGARPADLALHCAEKAFRVLLKAGQVDAGVVEVMTVIRTARTWWQCMHLWQRPYLMKVRRPAAFETLVFAAYAKQDLFSAIFAVRSAAEFAGAATGESPCAILREYWGPRRGQLQLSLGDIRGLRGAKFLRARKHLRKAVVKEKLLALAQIAKQQGLGDVARELKKKANRK